VPEQLDRENFYPVFKMLVARTRVLATVCDNAAEVLSEEFQDMVTGPLAAVQDVLKQCPQAAMWDGSFEEDDIIVEIFRHEAQRPGPPVSVKITHVPTDMSVESYSKQTAVENELAVRRALAERVRNEWERRQSAQEGGGKGSRRRRSLPTRN
jgi:hypothetical protein